MCFLGRGTLSSRDMSFAVKGRHIARDMCVLGRGTHIPRVMCSAFHEVTAVLISWLLYYPCLAFI